jgi:hypothetical protein
MFSVDVLTAAPADEAPLPVFCQGIGGGIAGRIGV